MHFSTGKFTRILTAIDRYDGCVSATATYKWCVADAQSGGSSLYADEGNSDPSEGEAVIELLSPEY